MTARGDWPRWAQIFWVIRQNVVSKRSKTLLPGRGVSQPQGSRIVLPLNSAQGLTSDEGTKDCFRWGGKWKEVLPRRPSANTRDPKEHSHARLYSILSPLGCWRELAGTLRSVCREPRVQCCVWRWQEKGVFQGFALMRLSRPESLRRSCGHLSVPFSSAAPTK